MSKHVLLVEDDEYIAKKLLAVLKARGYVTTHATHFKQVAMYIKNVSKSFDIVVCDYNFPIYQGKLSDPKPLGFDVLSLLRDTERYEHVPFILHTSDDTKAADCAERCVQFCYKDYSRSFGTLMVLMHDACSI